MKSLFTIFALSLFLISPAFAHDASMHKGVGIEGKVLEKKDNAVELQTDKEKTTVTFTKDTKFEAGHDGKEAKESDLKIGDHLMVTGHKMPGDTFMATVVMMHSEHEEETKEHH